MLNHTAKMARKAGFTLIEMSIVLVIIGLIVGGVLVGQSLIAAATVRSQISQIEKYNIAVNTFREKFGFLPGDMNVQTANQFGFLVGLLCAGQVGGRDGNGLIDGYDIAHPFLQTSGENNLFWQDLSSDVAGKLIDDHFPNGGAGPEGCNTAVALTLTPGNAYVGDYFPAAKIGNGNFIYVLDYNGANWYGLSAITQITPGGDMLSKVGLSVSQAYAIDTKTDDGVPTTGRVLAVYLNSSYTNLTNAPNTATSGGNATSCYDTTTNNYSITVNGGAGINCGLSFKMQAGD